MPAPSAPTLETVRTAAARLLQFAIVLAGAPLSATGTVSSGLEFFENRIRPVLAEHCYQCHSAGAAKIGGSLIMDTKEEFLKGGIDGPVVVPGDPEASLLIQAVRYDHPDRQMPPPKSGGQKLPETAITDLTAWVQMGAPYPETPDDKKRQAPRPWSLEPVQDPAPPPVRDTAWSRTSVDPFILAPIEARGLQPSPPASALTLIRRATFDLTGLPPTPEEIDTFLADTSPDAFARVVDRLLASPQYGEHWGRHWLDVVRYADTAGDTADYPLPEAWRYRNYVVDAFNNDVPYDQFLHEQIAGDIIAREAPGEKYAQQVTATGYLALSRRFGFDSENYHHLTIQDTIDTLGQSVLGLTVGCARCHDHKFDPVSMKDYYGLYGIFASTRFAFPGSEQKNRYRALVPLVPVVESRSKWSEMQSSFASLGITPSAVLRSLDDMDGDFEMQKPASGGSYGVVVPPWFYDGRVSVDPGAQSPFKHLHPFGSVGAIIPAEAAGYSMRQMIHPSLTQGVVHVNLEFRAATSGPDTTGVHRFTVGQPGIPAVEVFISHESISFPTANGVKPVPLPKPGDWNCLQLTLDLEAGTFSGTVGTPDQTTAIATQPLSGPAPRTINFVALDAPEASPGQRSTLSVDNISVQSTPIPPVSSTHPAPTPEAPALALAALQTELTTLAGMDGDLEAQTNGTPPSANWHPGPNSTVKISADAQSPLTNIHAAGSLGLHLPATAASDYNGFGNRLPQSWSPATGHKVYASFDFRCAPASAPGNGDGTWRFHLGHTPASPAVQLGINATSFFYRSGDTYEVAAPLEPGTWHQVQLTLDLTAKSFTGSVATQTAHHSFSGHLASGWDGSIDYLFIDSGGHMAGAKPALDTDNFMVSSEPLPPLTAPEVQLAGDSRPSRRARIEELRKKIEAITAAQESRRLEVEQHLATGPVPMAYAVTEGTPHPAKIQLRGEPQTPGAEVPRGFIQVLGHSELPAATTATSSGRLELARWLTRRDNPLTARVMANRLWLYHFNRGLVKTPNDFGTRSEPPTHPELLDHLATEFVRREWSIKAMHRLILLSATWQQSSATSESTPDDGSLYHVFPRRRLTAEELRDAILSSSGALDRTPGREHPFPAAHTWGYSQHGPFAAVYEHDKRSLYLMVQRIKRHPFLALFDGADPNSSTAERRITTVPTQALYFLNDPFVHAKSLAFAQRLQADHRSEDDQIELASRLALGRSATSLERAEAASFLAAYRAEVGTTGDNVEPMAAYVRTLFGSNEFLHCD